MPWLYRVAISNANGNAGNPSLLYKVHCGQIDAAVILNIVGGCEIRMRTVLLPPPPPDIDGGIVASNVMLPVALLTTGAVPLTQYEPPSLDTSKSTVCPLLAEPSQQNPATVVQFRVPASLNGAVPPAKST